MNSFIKDRLNKDNFWNLMFFCLSFTGLTCGFIIPQPIGGIIFWISIIVPISLVKRNTHLTFDKEKLEFTTSKGNKIKKSGIELIFLLILSFFISVGVISLFSNKYFAESLLDLIIVFFVLTLCPSLYRILFNSPISVYFKIILSFFISVGVMSLFSNEYFAESLLELIIVFFVLTLCPSLYCILFNFPISVYFKKEAWTAEGMGASYDYDDDIGNSFGDNGCDSRKTGMNYDYLPNNIWHSSYLNRHRR